MHIYPHPGRQPAASCSSSWTAPNHQSNARWTRLNIISPTTIQSYQPLICDLPKAFFRLALPVYLSRSEHSHLGSCSVMVQPLSQAINTATSTQPTSHQAQLQTQAIEPSAFTPEAQGRPGIQKPRCLT